MGLFTLESGKAFSKFVLNMDPSHVNNESTTLHTNTNPHSNPLVVVHHAHPLIVIAGTICDAIHVPGEIE